MNNTHDTITSKSNKNNFFIFAALIGVVFISLLAILIFRPKSTAAENLVIDSNKQNSEMIITTQSSEISFTINGQPVESLELETPTNLLSSRPLSEINASQISNVSRQDSNWIVTFTDGSQTTLNESRMKQFSDQLEFQVEYSRER
jgi:hypothetical protein